MHNNYIASYHIDIESAVCMYTARSMIETVNDESGTMNDRISSSDIEPEPGIVALLERAKKGQQEKPTA